jgi:cell division protein FtsA
MRSVKLPDDREEILSMQALCYTIDDKVVDVPVGAYGHVLKATYNFILSDRSKRDRLNRCLMNQGIKVKEFVPNALISHLAIATDEDIEEGVVVVDLGGGVTDVSILHRSKVRHIASIPIGADAINNDIRAYGIPANYVENLKRRYGSALTDLATDDKIVFPVRRGVPKSILRRNLATIIEARLKEIAEWVRREIKEAGCGTRFSPILLITGGGAEMQNIETLFARELGIDEVRAVYPEYGFTENLTDVITTTAYATVASLLRFGAERGTCSVAVGTRVMAPVVEEKPERPAVRVVAPKAEPAKVVEPEPEPTPEPEPESKPAIAPKPKPEPIDYQDPFDPGTGEKPKKLSFMERVQQQLNQLGSAFLGKEDDKEDW